MKILFEEITKNSWKIIFHSLFWFSELGLIYFIVQQRVDLVANSYEKWFCCKGKNPLYHTQNHSRFQTRYCSWYLIVEQKPKLLKPRFNIFSYDIVNSLADYLQRFNEGDIVFECSSIKNEIMKVLYAHSLVLKVHSRYYVNSKFIEVDDDA